MKKTKIILSLVMFLLTTTVAWGVSNMTGKWHGSRTALIYDTIHTIDANSLEMFVYNNGNFAYDNANILGKTDGLYYPRGTKKTVIYDAGLWIGAKVGNEVRVAMAEYSSEFVPGPMKDGTFQSDKSEFKVYKVKRGDNALTNPDYRDWPIGQGAPINADSTPALLGDQFLWSVCNDADVSKHTNNSGGTQPLGIEVQQSTFAYARGGALGNTVFMKFKIINKGGNRLDSAYVSVWADPDLGDAASDLVGCDTALSLGYCYNAGADNIYGAAPPAVGFDFFQGPNVPGEETDSAYSFGVWTKGKKKLGMTAFSKYINSEDPQSASETYLFMKGYRKFAGAMVPAVDPNGDTTTFVFAGDPQTQEGWLDILPNDRRLMMTAGPFTMEPGDSQEVVTAVLVGQGSDPLNSIGALKLVDQRAQAVFDLNFRIPNPPPSPNTWLRGADQQIEIVWDAKPINDVQKDTVLGQEFHFEGFNIYQGESAVGPWTKIATFDKADDDVEVALIYNDVVLAGAGGAQRMVVQKGSNSGLQYNYTMSVSQLDGSTIKNNQPYYFSVTSYSYDYLNATEFLDPSGNLLGHLVETLESPISSIEVKPFTFVGALSDTTHRLSGESDGRVDIEYVEPDRITGHTYEVGFKQDLTWFVQDMTLPDRDTVLNNQTNQDEAGGYTAVDGIIPKVVGLPPGIKGWSWVGGTRWLTGEDQFGGNLAWLNGGLWNGPDFWGSNIDPTADYVNVEIRFSRSTKQKAYDYLRGGTPNYGCIGYFDCPFTVWDVSANPARQLNAAFVEQNGGATYDSTWFPGANGTVAREYLIIFKSTYSATPEPLYLNDILNAGDVDQMYVLTLKIRPGHDPATEFVEGQKLVIEKVKPNLPVDRFQYVSKLPGSVAGDIVANALDNIKTVPNPYYSFYQEEVDQFGRIVKFINLPPAKMKIRIFNLAGDLVRTMERTDIYNSEFVWDLKTDQGLWVAPGVYIWLIEAEGLGTKHGKMAIFTEVEQLNIF